jgi:alkylated DNA repair dioxygenase AlkB
VPDWLIALALRTERFFRLSNGVIQQVLCTEYDEGVGIGWHRDKETARLQGGSCESS